MSVFYKSGESKIRPGVYRMLVDIGKKKGPASTNSWTPEPEVPLKVVYYEDTRTLSLSGGLEIIHNGIDTLTVNGLTHSYSAGTVTIGG